MFQRSAAFAVLQNPHTATAIVSMQYDAGNRAHPKRRQLSTSDTLTQLELEITDIEVSK